MKFNPKSEALAFRIWAVARTRGWNILISELASELEVSPTRVSKVLHDKGWLYRVPRVCQLGRAHSLKVGALRLEEVEKEIDNVRAMQ